EDESLPDHWIQSRLNRVIREMIRALDEYKFNEAAGTIYQFVWHELCDWYLELAKPVLYGKENPAGRQAAQRTLYQTLKTSLQLLHPFMPFLTEEIWQTLVGDGTSIMVSPFPTAEDLPEAITVEEQMGLIMNVITRVRNIRGEMGISPSKKLRVTVSAPEVTSQAVLTAGSAYITNLANLETLVVSGAMEEPKGAATGVIGNIRVFVLLEGTIDVASEKARLEKELAKVEKDLAIVSRKLTNSDFLAKAAEAIVRKEEEKHREFMEKKTTIDRALQKVLEIAQ
ncbi:MAG: class I tRNA ligase family protein, partial [Syntrophales bacterium LBB04]|nr:class I tRNA ligase family protein [Syntrophales bacterium LBB04]